MRQNKESLETIRIKTEAREASDTNKLHKENSGSGSKGSKPQGTNYCLVTNEDKIRCVYCNGENYSASCETIADSKQQKHILRKSGRCFVCLKTNRMLGNCVSTRNCRHCNNRHHQIICDRTYNCPVNQNSSGGSEKENNSKDERKNPENVTTSTTNTSTYRRVQFRAASRLTDAHFFCKRPERWLLMRIVIGLLRFKCFSTTVASEATLRAAYEHGWDSRLTR